MLIILILRVIATGFVSLRVMWLWAPTRTFCGDCYHVPCCLTGHVLHPQSKPVSSLPNKQPKLVLTCLVLTITGVLLWSLVLCSNRVGQLSSWTYPRDWPATIHFLLKWDMTSSSRSWVWFALAERWVAGSNETKFYFYTFIYSVLYSNKHKIPS